MTNISELTKAEQAAGRAVQKAQERLTFEQTAGADNARQLVKSVLERAANGEALDAAGADGHAREHLAHIQLTKQLYATATS